MDKIVVVNYEFSDELEVTDVNKRELLKIFGSYYKKYKTVKTNFGILNIWH